MSHALIITGMHRSGTSLVASLLQKSGLNIGAKLLEPGAANPRGFFEDVDFYEFHEQALLSRKETIFVHDQFVFNPSSTEMEQACALVEQRADLPLWGWKDPRTSLFLDFWQQLLPNARYLLIYRHPLDVLLSLIRRGDIYNSGLLEGLKTWVIYNERIKAFYLQHREASLLCDTYSIIGHVDVFSQYVRQKFGLDLPIDAETLQSLYFPGELHRAELTAEEDALLGSLYPPAIDLYRQLNAIADLPAAPQHESMRPAPDLSAASILVSSLPAPDEAPYNRALLLLSLSLIDPQTTERFFAGHAEYIKELYLWNKSRDRARMWWQAQQEHWQRVAEERQQTIEEQRTRIEKSLQIIEDLRGWIEHLEQAKAWWKAKHEQRQGDAEKRERIIQEQCDQIQQLNQEKAALEQQCTRLRQIVRRPFSFLLKRALHRN